MSLPRDADLERLAKALAQLLAIWYRQQADRHGEAAPWTGAADAEAPERADVSPGAPTSSSIAVDARSSRGVGP